METNKQPAAFALSARSAGNRRARLSSAGCENETAPGRLLAFKPVGGMTITPWVGTVADATTIRDTSRLTEVVRKRLARTISSRYQDSDGLLHVVTLDPELEDQLSLATAEQGECLSLPQKMTFQDVLRKTLDRLLTENRPPVLLTKSDLRLAVRQMAQAAVPGVVVIGRDEVTPESQIRSVGIVGLI
jgi:flagellar biosynthesis component FlhA